MKLPKRKSLEDKLRKNRHDFSEKKIRQNVFFWLLFSILSWGIWYLAYLVLIGTVSLALIIFKVNKVLDKPIPKPNIYVYQATALIGVVIGICNLYTERGVFMRFADKLVMWLTA